MRFKCNTFAKSAALFILVTLGSGCGGTSGLESGVAGGAISANPSTVLTERQLTETNSAIRSDRLVLLRLEPAGTDHGFDHGEAGVDRLKVEFSTPGTKEFSLETGDFQASLLDPSGRTVLQLGATARSGQATVGTGVYTWEFRNPGSQVQLVFAKGEGTVLAKSAPGVDLSTLDLSGEDLSGRDFRGAKLRGTSLLEADCRGTNFSGCDLTGALFSLANCDGADFEGADLTDTHSYRASFQGAKFSARNALKRTAGQVRAQTTFPGTIAVASPPNIVVTANKPLVITGTGYPVAANYGVLTIEDGGMIQVDADLSLHAQLLQLNGNAELRCLGVNGPAGRPGLAGLPGKIINIFGRPYDEAAATDGEAGGPGGDGENTSTAVLEFESVSGSGRLSVLVKPGDGGAGGKGGDGASWSGPPSSGGFGGPGGRGGDAENLFIYAPSSASGFFQGTTNPGNGGPGGAGGLAGSGSGGSAQDGIPGEAGLPGKSGTITIQSNQ